MLKTKFTNKKIQNHFLITIFLVNNDILDQLYSIFSKNVKIIQLFLF